MAVIAGELSDGRGFLIARKASGRKGVHIIPIEVGRQPSRDVVALCGETPPGQWAWIPGEATCRRCVDKAERMALGVDRSQSRKAPRGQHRGGRRRKVDPQVRIAELTAQVKELRAMLAGEQRAHAATAARAQQLAEQNQQVRAVFADPAVVKMALWIQHDAPLADVEVLPSASPSWPHRAPGSRSERDRVESAAIRDWARSQGIPVNRAGRLPKALRAAWEARDSVPAEPGSVADLPSGA